MESSFFPDFSTNGWELVHGFSFDQATASIFGSVRKQVSCMLEDACVARRRRKKGQYPFYRDTMLKRLETRKDSN